MNYFVMMAMVVVVVTLPLPNADALIDCYVCIGYDSSLPENELINNKYCPQGSFDSSKVTTTKGVACMAVIVEQGGKTLTERVYISTTTKMASNMTTRGYYKGSIHGYICDEAFCNDQSPSASSTLSFQLPLLLLSLLAALPRCLA